MKKDKFKIEDASGDRKYFVQIPNIIINHSTAYEQSLYLIMKRIAGEHGSCYSSLNFMAKNMGVDKKTVAKTISKLLARKWISEIESKAVRGGKVRQFVIVDLWALNVNTYESGRQIPSSESGSIIPESGSVVPESGRQMDTKKIDNKKEEEYKNSSSDEFAGVFDLKAEIQKLKKDSRRHIQLIGEYFEEKKLEFSNKKELSQAIKRHVRDAAALADFGDDKIGRATEEAEKEYPKYTLGTLVKILTR